MLYNLREVASVIVSFLGEEGKASFGSTFHCELSSGHGHSCPVPTPRPKLWENVPNCFVWANARGRYVYFLFRKGFKT